MPVEKGKRNALIVRLWNQRKSNQEILTALRRAGYSDVKDTHSLSGVVSRLKRAGKLPKERAKVVQRLTKIDRQGEEGINQQVTKSTNQQVYKRATFYLTPGMIKQIKHLAIERGKDMSGLAREILLGYLSKQSDL